MVSGYDLANYLIDIIKKENKSQIFEKLPEDKKST